MAERRFVLEPLAELAPDLRHPSTGQTIRGCWPACLIKRCGVLAGYFENRFRSRSFS